MNGGERLKWEFHVNGICLEHVSEVKYLGCVLDESGKDGAKHSRKVTGAIRSLINAGDLQLECAIESCMKHC